MPLYVTGPLTGPEVQAAENTRQTLSVDTFNAFKPPVQDYSSRDTGPSAHDLRKLDALARKANIDMDIERLAKSWEKA